MRLLCQLILLFITFALLYCSYRVHASEDTNDPLFYEKECGHNQNTVEFWEEEYKTLPAETLRVKGDEITIAIKDNKRQQVYVLHSDKDKPKEGKWYLFGFCRKCRYLFGFTPLK